MRWWNSSWAVSNPERWCCESAALNMPANLENLAVATGLVRSVFIPIPKKGNAKECWNYWIITLISHASKVILKPFKLGFHGTKILEVQARFRNGRGTRDQIANTRWIIEKAKEFQKNIYFCFIDYTKAFVWIITNCGKFLKRWEYQTTLPVSWETWMHV